MKKQLLSMLLVVIMVVGLLPIAVFGAETVDSGTCGENLTWTLDSDGTLTISGTGEMDNWGYYTVGCEPIPMIRPWEFCGTKCEIKSVVIKSGVTSIGVWAFRHITTLTDVTIEDGLMCIDASAFEGCTNLENIKLSDSIKEIGSSAFNGCTNLKNIILPVDLMEIGNSVFMGCTNLDNIKIPDGVKAIDYNVFKNCSSLTTITIPEGISDIKYGSFEDCSSLKEIVVESNNERYCSVDGVLFEKDMTKLIKYPNAKALSSYIIPESVTDIEMYAFNGCKNLEYIKIPDGVTKIGQVFSNCEKLRSIAIPDGVTLIGNYSFGYCKSLSEINIPGSVTKIMYGAFEGCNDLSDIYYSGTEEQWKSIEVDEANKVLSTATIHYVPFIDTDLMTITKQSDNTYTITAPLTNITEACTMVAVIYDENGVISGIGEAEVKAGDTEKTVSIKVESGADNVKLFLWNDLQNMIPLCHSVEKQIQ